MGAKGQSVGHWRRLVRQPPPTTLRRMRALLLDVGAGGAASVVEGIASLHEWRFLATFCDGAWSDGARRDSRAARTLLRRRLRLLGMRPTDVPTASALPVGSPVHLAGTAVAMTRGRPGAHIWRNVQVDDGGVRAWLEEGHDFFLADHTGQSLCVIAAGGQLINADEVGDGDYVSVVGYVDHVTDPRARAGSGHARGELSVVVRSGDLMPLVLRRLPAPERRAMETRRGAR